MSGAVPPDTPLAGRHNAIALEAMRRLPLAMLGRVTDIHDRQLRCLRSHPGSAVHRAMITSGLYTKLKVPIQLESNVRVSVDKNVFSEGGDISVVIDIERATLVRNVLRVFNTVLPHTVLASLPGRLVGDLAELSGLLSPLEDVRIEEVSEDGIIIELVLDLPHVPITRGDICRYALDAARA